MNPVRRLKLLRLLFIVVVLAVVTGLFMYALRQNISLFYTPTQVAEGAAPELRQVRVGGMVVKGSIIRSKKDLSLQFQLTDFKQTITVHYRGILPDLFREGQGIVAKGEITRSGIFTASEVLAKHDANYMPPEVKAALKNAKGKQNS